MNKPLTRTDLIMPWGKNPGAFYQLMPAMRIHVLPGKVSKIKGAFVDFEVSGLSDPGDANKIVGSQAHDEWVIRVAQTVRLIVKEHEQFVVIAFRSFEDALYFFYCRSFEVDLAHSWLKESACRREKGNDQTGYGKQADHVEQIHLIAAECRELDELRRACKRYVEKYPGYADDGCELFTAEQFESLLNERGPIHAQECTQEP